MENNKYPISINNRKCVGPCYEPKKFIIAFLRIILI